MSDERSPRRSSPALVALAGLSTAALGLALVGVLRPPRPAVEPRPNTPASPPAAVSPGGARASGADDHERARRLERRVAELEEAARPEASAPGAAPAAAADPELEAEIRETKAWWEGVIGAHRQERRDAAWAERTEGLFRDDLAAVAEGRKFEAVAIDCRTSSCSATLEWPSYAPDEIRKDTRAMMSHVYQENCAMSLSAPPPEDPGARYRAEVVFDCAAHRAGLAQR